MRLRVPPAVRRTVVIEVLVAGAALVGWYGSNRSYFWPRWVFLGQVVLPPLVIAPVVLRRRQAARPWLAIHTVESVLLMAAAVGVWALDVSTDGGGRGFFWPVWPLFALTASLAIHAWVIPGGSTGRERALIDRVATLTSTRADTLDAQASALRRVERDLHDGAQARLVSVGMTIGLAIELVERDAGAATELLGEARAGAMAALDELRSVMRGIQPPVLSDRGVRGALEALALNLAVPTHVDLDVPGRLPAPVEAATYFSIAECMANAVKHSGASTLRVTGGLIDGHLSVRCTDDGHGGADVDAGTGLAGVRQRLAALDGTMTIDSPRGGPTTISVEVPCASSSPRT